MPRDRFRGFHGEFCRFMKALLLSGGFTSRVKPFHAPKPVRIDFVSCISSFLPTAEFRMNLVKKILQMALAGVFLATWTTGTKAQGALEPVNLRCSGRANPLGIGDEIGRASCRERV